jgi:Uma2 family endonuclease
METLAKPRLNYRTDSLDAMLNGKAFVNLSEDVLIYRPKNDGHSMPAVINNKTTTYTSKDYFQLPEGVPYQLINGKLIYMASLTRAHQKVLGQLYRILIDYAEANQLGEVYFAPLDVEFSDMNIYQPDLLFVSNERKEILQERIKGAPDFVVEILSSKPGFDLNEKKEGYGKYGVAEYWIIDPEKQFLAIFENQNGEMQERSHYEKTGKAMCSTIKGFELDLEVLFRS